MNFRPPRLAILLLPIFLVASGHFAAGVPQPNDGDPTDGIRASLQTYLDDYFDPGNPRLHQGKTSLSTSTVRDHVVFCLRLSQQRMRDYRALYREEADIAAIRMNVRQDDALRLFLDADLVTCLANMHHKAPTDGRPGALSVENALPPLDRQAELFRRVDGMRTMLTIDEEAALSAIVEQYLSLADEAEKQGILQRSIQSIDALPIGIFAGRRGALVCGSVLICCAVALHMFDSYGATGPPKTDAAEPVAALSESQLRQSGVKKRAVKKSRNATQEGSRHQ